MISQSELIGLRDEAERVLSGVLGSAIATIVFENKLTLTETERGELSNSIKQITDTLRLSRQELAEANRNLAYLKEFSENIIESAPVGIVTIDSLLKITYWNKGMDIITGIKRSGAFNKNILQLLPWITREMLQNHEEETAVQISPFKSLKINISPFKDPSGGYVVICEDITEKKEMEEQLMQASKLASIGKLTAGISHEIGNPLASISSLVQELRTLEPVSATNTEFTAESLETINNHLERIAKIVRSLGDFARVSTGEKVRSDIPEILDRTINLVRYDKRFRDIQIKTSIDSVPLIKVNPDQIQQVFLNLLLNAFDAMPQGGSIDIAIKMSDGFMEMVLKDTGIGMDESVIEKIFDPFFTTKPFGKGTGLGMSICYGIISEHNGTITVKSKIGKGTTFVIKLPAETDA